MTGYGKSQVDLPSKTISIELRSLNSKQLDLNLRLPQLFREKEMEIRSLLGQMLERGKVDASVSIEARVENPSVILNKPLALQYYAQLKEISSEIPESRMEDILSILVKMPDVFKSEKEEIDEEEWKLISRSIQAAIKDLDNFRQIEGAILEKDFIQRINQIRELLKQVEPLESPRVTVFRNRFKSQLEELAPQINFDPNRLEQEIIYYIEKLDITEEKTRLRKHIDYFLSTLKDQEAPGKKLGFITQEIGREINTLGSKANDAEIQKLVVQMKDELEKIKEQLANIL